MAKPKRQSAERPPMVVITGPTASGKSGLALALAEVFDGVVINADSMQVYRDLRILTARPGPEALARAPHRLYGVLPGNEPCSAGHWWPIGSRATTPAPPSRIATASLPPPAPRTSSPIAVAAGSSCTATTRSWPVVEAFPKILSGGLRRAKDRLSPSGR